MSKNLSELSARKGLDKNLFEEISKPAVNVSQLADEFLVGTSSLKGSISFYDFLKEDNQNKKVYICNGSACLCAGTQDQLTGQLQQHFQDHEIGHMTCLGRCHENAAFHYQGQNYSALEQHQIEAILSGADQSEHTDNYHVESIGEAVLTAPELTHDQLNMLYDKLFTQDKAKSLEQLTESGLRGRGGAGFPIGFKIQSAQQIESDIKFVICNADEGDPGAYSDRFLLEQKPQMVLFGLVVAAYLSGAQTGILYIRAEYPKAISVVQQAIDTYYQSSDYTQLAQKVGFEFQFKLISAQGAYICGEETALINSIEGQRPEVRVRPPFPTQAGLFNKPTVVNNVETLASLYSIIQQGGKHYRSIGTEKSSGTKLISLDSAFNNPGVYEVTMGTSLSEVFETLGRGFKQPVKAVHIGGPLGGIIPVNKIDDLFIDFESFTAAGFLLGHASVVCIPNKCPIIKYLHHLFQFASYESCGKCFPCRLGTKRAEEMLFAAIKNDEKIDTQLFTDLLTTLEQGSLCAHGGGIPLPVRNALQYFSEELEQYFKDEQS